jgi:hypothetical protein
MLGMMLKNNSQDSESFSLRQLIGLFIAPLILPIIVGITLAEKQKK